MIFDPAFNPVATNALARSLWLWQPPEQPRNFVTAHFTDPRYRDVHPEWHIVADTVVALLRKARTDATAGLIDSVLDALGQCEEFQRRWKAYRVECQVPRDKLLKHSVVGTFCVRSVKYDLVEAPGLILQAFPAADRVSARKIEDLLKHLLS